MDEEIYKSINALDQVIDDEYASLSQFQHLKRKSEKKIKEKLDEDVHSSLRALDKVIDEHYQSFAELQSNLQKHEKNEDIRRSIEALDQILDEYDEGAADSSKKPPNEARRVNGTHLPPTPDQAADVVASFFPNGESLPPLPPRMSKNNPDTVPVLPPRASRGGQEKPVKSPTAAKRSSPGKSSSPTKSSSSSGAKAAPPPPKSPPPPQSGHARRGPPLPPPQDGRKQHDKDKRPESIYPPDQPNKNEKEHDDVTIPPPADYDDGPESGYTTSDHDQPSSESDYSIHTSQPGPGFAHTLASAANHRTDHMIRAGDVAHVHTLPPERASKVSSNLPGYHAPGAPLHIVPPPPTMGAPLPPSHRHITTTDVTVHQVDNVYETRLPEPVPPPPPMDLGGDDLYGAQLPESTGAYPGPHELYQTTLPTPAHNASSNAASSAPVTLPKRGASQAPPPPPPLATLPRSPPPNHVHVRSPESELPPPPPPMNFHISRAATSHPPAGGGRARLPSPPKMAPPTMPKPRKGSSMSPPMSPSSSSSSSSMGYGAPPAPGPPPGAATLPPHRPTPPPPGVGSPSTMPRSAPVQATPLPSGPAMEIESDLAAKLARVRLRADSVPETDEGSSAYGSAEDSTSGQTEVYNSADGVNGSPNRSPPATAPKPRPKPTVAPPPEFAGDRMPTGNGSLSYDNLDFDPTQLKGYQAVPDNLPEWKKAMMKKKNDALVEEHMKTMAEVKAEQDKWDGIPEWKKKLMIEKEKKKVDETSPEAQEAARRQQEMERLNKLPAWKRDLLLKKKGEL